MKRLLFALVLMAMLALPALADKPIVNPNLDYERVACNLISVCWTWDGSFTTSTCDTGGAAIWQYGIASNIPTVDCDGNAVGPVLATILNGSYPNDSGQRALLGGSFTVTEFCYLLEICHFYEIENSYDGGNVEVYHGGTYTVITPMGGYPDALISDSTSFYAWCVDMQPGYTSNSNVFVKACFDLSAYMGQTVQIAFKFGSDNSVVYRGWYISSVVAGGLTTPVEDSNWSTIKQLY
jgi:hypothetical protein